MSLRRLADHRVFGVPQLGRVAAQGTPNVGENLYEVCNPAARFFQALAVQMAMRSPLIRHRASQRLSFALPVCSASCAAHDPSHPGIISPLNLAGLCYLVSCACCLRHASLHTRCSSPVTATYHPAPRAAPRRCFTGPTAPRRQSRRTSPRAWRTGTTRSSCTAMRRRVRVHTVSLRHALAEPAALCCGHLLEGGLCPDMHMPDQGISWP